MVTKSVLEEFAKGNISAFAKYNPSCEEAENFLLAMEKKIASGSYGGVMGILNDYNEIKQKSNVESFIWGFRLGLMMTAECFINKEDYLLGNAEDRAK